MPELIVEDETDPEGLGIFRHPKEEGAHLHAGKEAPPLGDINPAKEARVDTGEPNGFGIAFTGTLDLKPHQGYAVSRRGQILLPLA